MGNIFGGGSNLPPGCRVSDIPGNRPEDGIWEAIYDRFYDKERLTKTHTGVRITEAEYLQMDELYDNPELIDVIDNYIMAAIEYGMEIGTQQAHDAQEENKYYEAQWHEEVRNPKLRAYFKALREKVNKEVKS